MNKDRVVISGINGFVGYHLAKELRSMGASVTGIGREERANDEVKALLDEYHQADLINEWPATSAAKAVIHLAGLAAVGPSFDSPQTYINSNSAMVTNMCEFYLSQGVKPRVIVVSSGAVYDSSQPMPINETSELGYTSPYAVSKVLNENQAAYYRRRGLDCIVARPFNHIGPGQRHGFILPDFHDRLSSLGDSKGTIDVGNIETRRDYTDVRDIVRAYGKLALATELNDHTYNICSGSSLSGADILNELKSAMKLPDVNYVVDQSLVRPSDIQEIVGDSTRIQAELGWKPQHKIADTIADFVASKK